MCFEWKSPSFLDHKPRKEIAQSTIKMYECHVISNYYSGTCICMTDDCCLAECIILQQTNDILLFCFVRFLFSLQILRIQVSFTSQPDWKLDTFLIWHTHKMMPYSCIQIASLKFCTYDASCVGYDDSLAINIGNATEEYSNSSHVLYYSGNRLKQFIIIGYFSVPLKCSDNK